MLYPVSLKKGRNFIIELYYEDAVDVDEDKFQLGQSGWSVAEVSRDGPADSVLYRPWRAYE